MTKTIETPGIAVPPEIVDDFTRREFLIGAGLIALAPACGGDSGSEGTGSSGETRTIRSRFGSAEIEGRPGRVVAIDSRSADAALALGVAPVGMSPGDLPDGLPPWTEAALRGEDAPTLLRIEGPEGGGGMPVERIAGLEPDLILAVNSFDLDEDNFETLSGIAPIVHFAEDPLTETWQDGTNRIGRALGEPDRARALVAETERGLAEVRERTPAFDGKTVNLFNAYPGGIAVINDPSDYAIRFLSALGMRLDPEIEALEGVRPNLSKERLELLDADLLIGAANTPEALADLEGEPLFERLGAVRDGRYVPLSVVEITAIAAPSLLSVRWATTEIIPRLETAVEGG